jgi:hypothetical protein
MAGDNELTRDEAARLAADIVDPFRNDDSFSIDLAGDIVAKVQAAEARRAAAEKQDEEEYRRQALHRLADRYRAEP